MFATCLLPYSHYIVICLQIGYIWFLSSFCIDINSTNGYNIYKEDNSMNIKDETIYIRLNSNKKEKIRQIAEAENRTISNLIETLIDEKIKNFEYSNMTYAPSPNYKADEKNPTYNLEDRGDNKKLREFLSEKNITLKQFKMEMNLRPYEFKKLFYGKGIVDKELAKKIEEQYGVKTSYWE